MASSKGRKPLPALAFLLALSLLTGLVWWRVLHRSDSANASPSCSTSKSPTVTPTADITVVPAATSVIVTVLNSTQRGGLASQVTTTLKKDGFQTGLADNDHSDRAPVTGVAEIRFGPSGAAGAKLMSYYVVGSVLVPDARTTNHIDLALGTKYTALVAPTDVKKALVAAHVSQLPAAVGTSGAKSSTAAASSSSSRASSSSSSSGSASPTC